MDKADEYPLARASMASYHGGTHVIGGLRCRRRRSLDDSPIPEKLYRRLFGGPYLRCVTPREAARILAELHEGDCGSEAIAPTEMHVRTTVSGSTSQEENNELMALSLDLLDEKREAAQLRNWSFQQDVAKMYNKKVRTRTFQQGDCVLRRAEKTTGKFTPGWEGPYKVIELRRAGAYRLQDSKVKIQPNCLPRPLILANPHKSGTTIVARPQRIKMGMRHKAGMGSNLNPASPDVLGTEIHTVDFRLNKESRRTLVFLRVWSLRSDRTVYVLGRYVATKLGCSSVASFGCTRSLHSERALARARSLRSDRAWLELGRYIATELGLCVVRWP
uniref:Uncharacterized protein n=1 Tax=Brassica oleracea var. oleracea TaxID=109376 RepID=A0A0D2ZPZ0_BRAOL